MKPDGGAHALAPLGEPVQRGERVYQALLNGIIRGDLPPGAQLNGDSVAQQLKVSTTPVRDALNLLEKDGLVVKLAYQGWFVRRFQESEIRDVYEMRAGLERFSVRLACERITPEEIAALRLCQAAGESAFSRRDMEAYRLYNQELHGAIIRAARNSQLPAVLGPISLITQMLSARTIRLGRSARAVREHRRLIELVARRDVKSAQALIERHILGALEEILDHGLE